MTRPPVSASRKRGILIRTSSFAIAIGVLLTICRMEQSMANVALAFALYVITGTLWIRAQYDASLTGGVWSPPFWWSLGLGILAAVGAALGFTAWESGTALIVGITGFYFFAGYVVMDLRTNHWTSDKWPWTLAGLGGVVVASTLFLDTPLGAAAFGLALIALPVPLSVVSARMIRWVDGHGARQEKLAGCGLGLLLVGCVVSWLRVPHIWTVVGLAVIVLLVVAIVSSTHADVAVVIAAVALLGITPVQAVLPDSFTPAKHQTNVLVALGDSYMSGEGAKVFFEGTDEADNECRRAPTAWAAMAGQRQPFDGVEFLACSGAVTRNVRSMSSKVDGRPAPEPQYDGIGTQLDDYVEHAKQGFTPGLVVMSLGGNDAGFSTIGAMCLAPGGCKVEAEKLWTANLPALQEELTATYKEVAETINPSGTEVAKRVRIVVVGYPDPVYQPPKVTPPGLDAETLAQDCGKIALSANDRDFVEGYVSDLNDTVSASATAAGLEYLSMENALADAHLQLCDPANDGRPGLNFIGLRSVSGAAEQRFNPQNWYHNSLHPNELGHAAMLQTFERWLKDPASDDEPNDDVGEGTVGRAIPVPSDDASGSEPVLACELYDVSQDTPACTSEGFAWIGETVRHSLWWDLWGLLLLMVAGGTWLLTVGFFGWRRDLREKEGRVAGEDSDWLPTLWGSWNENQAKGAVTSPSKD
jgi:hypothetical protein